MKRREFTPEQRRQIVERATRNGQIYCEGCGGAVKTRAYEIDHIIAEALRPSADKKQKLTIADGQLLGKTCCHRGPEGKTRKDVGKIAKAKRRFDRANGLKQARSSLSAKEKQPKRLTKECAGVSEIQRRFQRA